VVYLITYIIIFIARKKKLEKPKHDDENPDKNKTPFMSKQYLLRMQLRTKLERKTKLQLLILKIICHANRSF
jgi:hypothetical protein